MVFGKGELKRSILNELRDAVGPTGVGKSQRRLLRLVVKTLATGWRRHVVG